MLELPFSEMLDRQMGRHAANLSRTIRMAMERGEWMKRLTAEVAKQTKMACDSLRRTMDLVRDLTRLAGATPVQKSSNSHMRGVQTSGSA